MRHFFLIVVMVTMLPFIVSAENIKLDLNTTEPLVIQGPIANKDYCIQEGAPYNWDDDYKSCYLIVKFYDGSGMRVYLNEDETFNRELTLKGLKEEEPKDAKPECPEGFKMLDSEWCESGHKTDSKN